MSPGATPTVVESWPRRRHLARQDRDDAYASFDPPPTRNPWDLPARPAAQQRLGGGHRLRHVPGRARLADRRLDHPAGVLLRRFRTETDLWPRQCAGVVPLAPSMDHPGPIARCVRDLAILLQLMQGPDFRDPSSPPRADAGPRRHSRPDAQPPAAAPGRLRGPYHDEAEPVMRECIDDVCVRLREAGAEVVDVALPAGYAEVIPRHRIVMAVEAAMFHEPRLAPPSGRLRAVHPAVARRRFGLSRSGVRALQGTSATTDAGDDGVFQWRGRAADAGDAGTGAGRGDDGQSDV